MLENINIGIIALVSGMGIVFAVLIFISLIIWLFEKIFAKEIEKESQALLARDASHDAMMGIKVESDQVEAVSEAVEEDEYELIAVITAAIASMLETSSDQLVVRSFKKIKRMN